MVLISVVAKNRLPKSGQQGDLVLLPPMRLTQATMSRAVGLRNQIRLFREELHKMGEEMFSLVDGGAEIESGTHTASIERQQP